MDNLYLIAAIGKNNELGYNNDLIWKINEDLSFFKNKTMGNFIIMGRNTYNSIPKRLKGRRYIVLTSNNNLTYEKDILVFNNKDNLLEFISNNPNEIFYIIGGFMVYKSLINEASILFLTEIDASFKDATVFFPNFNKNDYDITLGNVFEENNIKYRHNIYIRKKVKYE